MKMHWAALAAVTAMAAMPAMAQNNMTTMSNSSMTMNTKNVDVSAVRDNLDKLRGYLDRMQENSRLMYASGGIVQADGYRRNNVVLLDNATAITMNTASELGGPMTIPAGWGLVRDYVADIGANLASARLSGDYGAPIMRARKCLDMAFDAMNQSNMGMSGGMGTNMNG